MKKYIILASIIFAASSCANNKSLELYGKISMKGSTPHTYLAIEDKNTHKEYKISNPNKFDLSNKQNRFVKLKAKLIKKAIGAGFPAVIEVVEAK